MKGKTKEKIEADRDNLLLSLELVTIDTDVPLEPGLEAITASEPDVQELRGLFQELDFRSLAEEVSSDVEASGPGEREDVLVRDAAGLEAMIEEPARPVRSRGTPRPRVSTPSRWTSWACPSAPRPAAFYRSFNLEPPVLEGGTAALLDAVRPLMTDPDLQRVAQNEKYDALVMGAHGVDVPPPFFDTMVASFTIHGSSGATTWTTWRWWSSASPRSPPPSSSGRARTR